MPQSLRTASISVSNITIQWDRVNCLDRNGPIDSYVVFYYPTSNPNDIKASSVFGTRDGNRMFSIIGLPPRTSYTFEVEAINPLLRGVFGVQAIITVNTTAPQSEIVHGYSIRYFVIYKVISRYWFSFGWTTLSQQ